MDNGAATSIDLPSRDAWRAHADLAWRVLDAELTGGPDVNLTRDEVQAELTFRDQLRLLPAAAGALASSIPNVLPFYPGIECPLPISLHDDGSATIRVR